jgi:hypothetical protein
MKTDAPPETQDQIPLFYLLLATTDLFMIMVILASLEGHSDPYFPAVVMGLWAHLLFCSFAFNFKMEEGL